MSEAASGFSKVEGAHPVPRVFGRLYLLKLLARGGMGDVYLAATTGIEGAERPVIVKTVRRDHIHDGSFLARFLDEARVQAQLNHPGVAQVLEAATDENGEPFTVVEYVEGRSLADVRARAVQLGARIGWAEAVALAIEMAQALAHVHERSGPDGAPLGIVHRDLSPQNVMVSFAGEVKLIDFGTARGHNRRCHTVAGVVFAKPGYVAPEVARQQVGDGRIDLYALGIMLWELVAGRRLLTGDPQKHLEDAAAGLVTIPEIAREGLAPRELDEVIAKLTANDPDDRYGSGQTAASDLAKILSTAPSSPAGERGVRARIAHLMRTLWPHEPGRSRSEFARLLREASSLRRETKTPPAGTVMDKALRAMSDDPDVLSGTPYRLGRVLGQGASGVVYEAEHVELGRKVALKVLSPSHTSAHDAVDRFRREARAVANLNHPNLVRLYDFGKSLDGRVFLAMELLNGKTLEQRLRDDRGMDWREAAELGIEITRALEAAHEAGLVHRDLKPANLFLTDTGSLKLLDFGVAMALAEVKGESSAERPKGFAIFGTPEYMAPEQVAGEAVDARCDLYALGCVLYELVTGKPPFDGGSSVVVMGRQIRETVEPPRVRAPGRGIPVELDAVIVRALSKEPEHRFESAQAMRAALENVLAVPAKKAQARGRQRTMMGAALGTVFVGATTLAAVFGGAKPIAAPTSPLPGPISSPVLTAAEHEAPRLALAEPLPTKTAAERAQASLEPAPTPLPERRALRAPELAMAVATARGGAETSRLPPPKVTDGSKGRGGGEPLSPRGSLEAARESERADRFESNARAARPRDDRPLTSVQSQNEAPPTESRSRSDRRAAARVERASAEGQRTERRSARAEGELSRTDDEATAARTPSAPPARDMDSRRERLVEARRQAKGHMSDVRALKAWANAALKAGELREARRAAEAWQLHDGTVDPRIFMATVLEVSGQHHEATELLEEWLERHPDAKEARLLLGYLRDEKRPSVARR